ncbi:MAG: hypothetical protein KDJ29_10270 [Hyphomicrobiales bacterium]|nr:hypothetical protein [Hyphomicrobiales bacterium]
MRQARHIAGASALLLLIAIAPARAQMWGEMEGAAVYERACGRCHFWPGRFTEYSFLPGKRAAFYNFMERHHGEDPALRLTVMAFVRAFSRKHKLVSAELMQAED